MFAFTSILATDARSARERLLWIWLHIRIYIYIDGGGWCKLLMPVLVKSWLFSIDVWREWSKRLTWASKSFFHRNRQLSPDHKSTKGVAMALWHFQIWINPRIGVALIANWNLLWGDQLLFCIQSSHSESNKMPLLYFCVTDQCSVLQGGNHKICLCHLFRHFYGWRSMLMRRMQRSNSTR